MKIPSAGRNNGSQPWRTDSARIRAKPSGHCELKDAYHYLQISFCSEAHLASFTQRRSTTQHRFFSLPYSNTVEEWATANTVGVVVCGHVWPPDYVRSQRRECWLAGWIAAAFQEIPAISDALPLHLEPR